MTEILVLFTSIGGAFRRNRWYVIAGLSLFGLVEMLGRLLGWS